MRRCLIACTLAVFASTAPVLAEEHEVQMLTKGPEGQRNWFEPAVVFAQPGDTINFVSTDSGHNSESLEVPEGAEAWKGKINEDLSVTLDTEGLYAYKCTPHLGLGMVGLVVVGDPSSNVEAVKSARYPGRSKGVMEELLAEVEEQM